MSFLVKQAGGVFATGYERILDMTSENLRQRVQEIPGRRQGGCRGGYHPGKK